MEAGLAEHALRVRAKRRFELLVGAVGIDEGALDAHARHGVREQVVRATVNGGRRHDVVARPRDVEHGEEIGRLAGRRQHGGGAALELGDLRRHRVIGGVLQARVEIARLLKIEQLAHVLARVVLPRRVLIDGNLARLGIARAIPALHADGFYGLGHVNSVSFYTAERKSPLAISGTAQSRCDRNHGAQTTKCSSALKRHAIIVTKTIVRLAFFQIASLANIISPEAALPGARRPSPPALPL